MTLDLNADLGELDAEHDARLLPYLDSCNVSCGFHAGDPLLIERTVRRALELGVKAGAHPSYHDREHFGRRSLADVPLPQLEAEWRYQIGALRDLTRQCGGRLHHVKAHGALYNDLNQNPDLARAFLRTVQGIDPALIVYVLAHSLVVKLCLELGVPHRAEGFVDRRYERRDRLRSRQLPGAVLDPTAALAQVRGFLRGELTLHDGSVVPVAVDTLCVHGDTAGALALTSDVRRYLSLESGGVSQHASQAQPLTDIGGPRRCLSLENTGATQHTSQAQPLMDIGGQRRCLGSENSGITQRASPRDIGGLIEEVITTETETLLKLRRPPSAEELRQLRRFQTEAQSSGQQHRLPVRFTQHADWKTVEERLSIPRAAYIERLLDLEFRVAQYGFMPGFVYLSGLPEAMQLPRKETPAKRVPRNALAVGGPYLGVYPAESPGGWYVLGESLETLYQPDQTPPVRWRPGDTVRLCLP